MALEREVEVACALAVRAGEVALLHRAKGILAESKADFSPVTAADRECERLISRLLEESFPADGLLGEEGALKQSASGRRWIIDPIDGTRDYLRQVPTWAVLIALEDADGVAAGVAHFPEQNRTYYAARHAGAWRDGSLIRVSTVTDPGQALLCVNGFNEALRLPFAAKLLDWMSAFWAVRSFGGCQDAVLLAAGQAEAWIEPAASAWDLAPLKILIEEAGGVFFNFDGRSSIYGGNCAACVPALEAEVRRFVTGALAG